MCESMYWALRDVTFCSAQVREDPPEKRAAAKKKSSGKDVATALDPLEGRCATVAHEYWSYKWCHRGEVTQVHTMYHRRLIVGQLTALPEGADKPHFFYFVYRFYFLP